MLRGGVRNGVDSISADALERTGEFKSMLAEMIRWNAQS